jgi:hypothetical protein
MACDLSEEWLDSDYWDWPKRYDYKDKIIINRTERYINPYISYFFLKDYENDIIFSGTEHEHEIFCKQNNLQMPRLEINNFLELAKTIASCRFFVGNQSLNWHLADAQKVTRILELCPQFPNTFPTGANGYAFYHQKTLEYYFQQRLNETNK